MTTTLPDTRQLSSYIIRDSQAYPPQNGTFVTTENVGIQSSVNYGPNFLDWKDRIRTKRTAVTSLDATKVHLDELSPADVSVRCIDLQLGVNSPRVDRFYLTGFYPAYSADDLVTANDVSLASNLALMRLNSSMSSARSSFKGAVFLGELREAIHMIRRPAAALQTGLSDYLANLKKSRRSILKNPRRKQNNILSSLYLEATFGWQPLVADIKNAAVAASRIVNDNFGRNAVDIRGVGVIDQHISLSPEYLSYVDISARIAYRYKRLTVTKTVVVYDGELIIKSDYSDINNVSSAVGLEFREFFPTVWELLPWSFVIDYFTNVGNLMEGLSNYGLNPAWLRRTIVKQTFVKAVDHRLQLTGFGPDYLLDSKSFTPSKFTANFKSVSRRDATYDNLMPSLRFELPSSGRKLLNLGALFANRGKGLAAL